MSLNTRLVCVSSMLFTCCLLVLGVCIYFGDMFFTSTRISPPLFVHVQRQETHKTLPVVLLTAYMHSGSSIVGSLFAKDPRTTFIYEPGLAMDGWRYLYKEIHHNGSIRQMTEKQKHEFEHYYLQKMFRCDFTNLPTRMCQYIRSLTTSSKEECSTKCIEDSPEHSTRFPAYSQMRSCISKANITMDHYSQLCRKSLYISSKLLRYKMRYLLKVLKQREEIYLIHLLRDPRGIVNSFVKDTSEKKDKKTKHNARWICRTMKENLEVLKGADTNISKRITIVHYEDFVQNPFRFTEDLYKVISMEIPKEVQEWIIKATSNSKNQGRYVRQNSTETAEKWKTSLTEDQKNIINQECSPLLASFEDLNLLRT